MIDGIQYNCLCLFLYYLSLLLFFIIIFSSPEPKAQVSYLPVQFRPSCVVRRP